MRKRLTIIGAVFGIMVVSVVAVIFAAERYTSSSTFCTQCHIMKTAVETWKKDKHKTGSHSKIEKDVDCIECHYAPGDKMNPKVKFRGLGQLFSYIATGDKEVRKRAVVNDSSCMTAKCHPKENFFEKKIEYKTKYKTDYKGALVPFTHKTHDEKTIEGQKLRCSSCHIHQSAGRHFEVPKELCFLCHFRSAKDNEGRAKCAVCHVISKEALRAEKKEENTGENKAIPMTHQSLEKAKVACSSCHIELVMGKVEVKDDSCIECHHNPTPELMKTAKDKKKMHEEHVTKQTARCFSCHQPLEHKKSPYLDAAIRNCATCHPEPHRDQKLLIAGEGGNGTGKYPIAHDAMKTNCLGCHTKDGLDGKGRKVRVAEMKSCVECHADKELEKQAKKWKRDVSEELKAAREVEKEAISAIEEAKGKLPDSVVKKALSLLKDGQEMKASLIAGGGVHNKKYAMLLIETGLQKFESIKLELNAGNK
ncbi:MAG: cytochrome c3 family protein [Deltaproteobacteria bacterium]|nr:cytochrome c3 family protein [Deltaproteobacteria bacterium]